MNNDVSKNLGRISAPFGKQIDFEAICLENNVRFLRVRVKEGQRFTVIDLDPVSVDAWQCIMDDWVDTIRLGRSKE